MGPWSCDAAKTGSHFLNDSFVYATETSSGLLPAECRWSDNTAVIKVITELWEHVYSKVQSAKKHGPPGTQTGGK